MAIPANQRISPEDIFADAEIGSDYGAPVAPRKVWHAGTLSYTAGGLVVLFCWLLWGDFAFAMRERSLADVAKLLFAKFHASDLQVALFFVALPQIITIVLGPIISYQSDRHRGRWGRRVPYLLIPTPIAAISMIGLGLAPRLGEWLHAIMGPSSMSVNSLSRVLFGGFWTVFEIAAITTNSVFGAFVNDVVPRPLLGRFYGMFRAVSLIAGILFNYYLFGKAVEYYLPIFIVVALLYGVGLTSMCLKVKEGQYPPSPVDQSRAGSSLLAARSYFRECFTKPYYYWVFAAIIIPNMSFAAIYTFNLFFSQRVGVSSDLFGKLTALFFLMSLVLTLPLGWLADKFHPLRIAMLALVLHAIASLWGGLFIREARTFAVGFIATGVLAGTWGTATASLTAMLLPKMKFAQYASALGLLSSLCVMVFGPVMGHLLDRAHHQYRYTYVAAFVLDAASLLVTVVVYREFLALGGMRHYVAPE